MNVALIGDFTTTTPSQAIMSKVLQLFDDAAALGKISEDYIITGQMDLRSTTSPGAAAMKIIKEWPRYSSTWNIFQR